MPDRLDALGNFETTFEADLDGVLRGNDAQPFSVAELAEHVIGQLVSTETNEFRPELSICNLGYLKLFAAVLDAAIREGDEDWINADSPADLDWPFSFNSIAAALRRTDESFRRLCLEEIKLRRYWRDRGARWPTIQGEEHRSLHVDTITRRYRPRGG